MKIMVVDDSKTSIMLISLFLKELGHEVIALNDPRLAVDTFKVEQPDLIILDVVMDIMNGYECAAEIRKITDQSDNWIPIIFLSGDITDESVAKGIEAGGDDYLTKPYSEVVLKAKINAMKRISDMRKNLSLAREKLERYNQMLAKLSITDGLTGITNRRAFDKTLRLEWSRASRLDADANIISLIMIDIDYFKNYNDTYGHLAGDECLTSVATTISDVVKRSSSLVARYGGEEFAVILPNTTEKEALIVATKIQEALSQLSIPYPESPVAGHVTVSQGVVALHAEKQVEHTNLITLADKALYEAKDSGRNQIKAYRGDPI